jgi:ribonuclease J
VTPGDELIFLPLGGSGEIGMNLNLYGCRGKWIMADLGMTFAGTDYPGVELIFPDTTFIEERRKDLLGIVLTHGHEDHLGAVPYLAAELGVPVYATPFTAALLKAKLEDDGDVGAIKIKVIPLDGAFTLGPFSLRYVSIAHSIPEGTALVIDTPHGRVFHTGDWKLDDDPIIGKPAAPETLSAIGDAGVLAMVCDSTNVFNREASGSEGGVRDGLAKLLKGRKGRIVVTTFASNAARVVTLAKLADQLGRAFVLAGRSLERISKVARDTGYFKDLPRIVSVEEAEYLPADAQLIVCTGCQGEPNAAMARIASGEHSHIHLEPGDTVVFSSKQIPGNETAIGHVINKLEARDISVITEKDAHVHVSGHPSQPELKAMYEWIRPKIAVPVHGEMRHMRRQGQFAKKWGAEHVVVPTNGAAIRLAPGEPEVIEHVQAGRLALDGEVIIPADSLPVVVRRRLQHNGFLGCSLVVDRKGRLAADPVVSVHGLPIEDEREDVIAQCQQAAEKAFVKTGSGAGDERLAEQVRIAIRRVLRDHTGKRPVTDVHIIRLA